MLGVANYYRDSFSELAANSCLCSPYRKSGTTGHVTDVLRICTVVHDGDAEAMILGWACCTNVLGVHRASAALTWA